MRGFETGAVAFCDENRPEADIGGGNMDGVVIYFGGAAIEEVCREFDATLSGADPDTEFAVFPYEDDGWRTELDGDEVTRLVRALGMLPSCAVHIASRHGQAARHALSAVAAVMSKFPNSVLDGDFDRLWSASQVMALGRMEPSKGLYAFPQSSED